MLLPKGETLVCGIQRSGTPICVFAKLCQNAHTWKPHIQIWYPSGRGKTDGYMYQFLRNCSFYSLTLATNEIYPRLNISTIFVPSHYYGQ